LDHQTPLHQIALPARMNELMISLARETSPHDDPMFARLTRKLAMEQEKLRGCAPSTPRLIQKDLAYQWKKGSSSGLTLLQNNHKQAL
jgi:hypothetical protein